MSLMKNVVALLGTIAVLLIGFGAVAGNPASAQPLWPGKIWRVDHSGTSQPLYSVACLSAQRCEAVGAGGTIVSTSNGGRTWRAQANPLRGTNAILYRITCVAPGTCVVIARPDTILVTHNGGASWSRHVLRVGVSKTDLTDQACLNATEPSMRGNPVLCRLGLLDVACVSARVCYAVSATSAAYAAKPVPSSAQPSSVWLTTDGGARWTQQHIPPGGVCNGDCGPGLFGYPLEWVSCLGSGLCRAGGGQFLNCGHCGFAYAVLAVSRAGAPWRLAGSFSPDMATCPTAARCYGVYSASPFLPGNQVYETADGAKNWQARSGGTSRILNDITCPATLTCYATGNHGAITRTVNGAAFAADGISHTTRDLFGIACVSVTRCYVVGAGGTILARQ
jgi:hypothetical protein